MESSSSSKPTREEQPTHLTPHEYIRDSFSLRYQDCISCGNRTGFTCIKCGYCYSCHGKKEGAEKRLLDRTVNEIFPVSPSSTRKNAHKLECLHQCVRCGILYPCKEGPDGCQRAFYHGKCLLC
jgi:hypothetical protein